MVKQRSFPLNPAAMWYVIICSKNARAAWYYGMAIIILLKAIFFWEMVKKAQVV
jgi:hypothetical protein